MMAVHELGHVTGAILTGGSVERVVLHPLAISRTDVDPNPNPAMVVWLGPVVGCLLPVTMALLMPQRATTARNVALFFAGFCLIANGAYIGGASFGQVGDASVMLRTGSPIWLLWLYGILTMSVGIVIWHRLGSPKGFLRDPALVPRGAGSLMLLALIVMAAAAFLLSPR